MMRLLTDTMLQIYELGGVVVLILGAISIMSFSIILYKVIQFYIAGLGSVKHKNTVMKYAQKGEHDLVEQYFQRTSNVKNTTLKMALNNNASYADIEAQAESDFWRLERGFKLLDVITQIAPLLGLFGTVLGMISAFQALQEAGSQVDPSILAGGIWVALLTTAVGLGVAMPTMIALSWLERRIEAERVSLGLMVRQLMRLRS